jgi:hypothetical protein
MCQLPLKFGQSILGGDHYMEVIAGSGDEWLHGEYVRLFQWTGSQYIFCYVSEMHHI